MPELIEQMYCSQQIVIPPKFPYILKRYAKAAIKTQPYDLLRWSYEYFQALVENRSPPVKLRLEYPVFSTEGGLTRGYLKVISIQLEGITDVPITTLRSTWQGSCLDVNELYRILCLCEVYMREESVPKLHFLAVAGGLLTKSLTQTMVLLCETLTKEPEGGSAAIPIEHFLTMYEFIARMDASKDVKYYDGYREGEHPPEETIPEETHEESEYAELQEEEEVEDEFWETTNDLGQLELTDDSICYTAKFSRRLTTPLVEHLERDPSVLRAAMIDRDNFIRGRRGKLSISEDKSRDAEGREGDKEEVKDDGIKIFVYDEDDNPVALEIYGEPEEIPEGEEDLLVEERTEEPVYMEPPTPPSDEEKEEAKVEEEEAEEEQVDVIVLYVNECYKTREERREDLQQTFEDIAKIVDRYKSANYDCGMVAGRQMSTTSAEFIVSQIERDILDYIDEQIAILPDPDLKKKKAKPEEVAMVREIVEQFIDENMHIFVPEVEEVVEEEPPLPEVTNVFAVPGIGPPVEEDLIKEFTHYARGVSVSQADMFMPRNIRHFLCPPLERYAEHDFEAFKKEKIPIGGGILTD